MHEYRLSDEELAQQGISKNAYVVCRIFHKSGMGPKTGEQYGAPYVEEEWEEAVQVLPRIEEGRNTNFETEDWNTFVQQMDADWQQDIGSIFDDVAPLISEDGDANGIRDQTDEIRETAPLEVQSPPPPPPPPSMENQAFMQVQDVPSIEGYSICAYEMTEMPLTPMPVIPVSEADYPVEDFDNSFEVDMLDNIRQSPLFEAWYPA